MAESPTRAYLAASCYAIEEATDGGQTWPPVTSLGDKETLPATGPNFAYSTVDDQPWVTTNGTSRRRLSSS